MAAPCIFAAATRPAPTVGIPGTMTNVCYASALLGVSVHPLLLRRARQTRDLSSPGEAIFVGKLINQAVKCQEKAGQTSALLPLAWILGKQLLRL